MSKRRLDQEEHTHQILCDLAPCTATPFETHLQYTAHLKSVHHHRCLECNLLFPSNDILQLHIDENHNPLLLVKQERGEKIFRCVSRGCDKVCSTPKNRRLHMIDKHGYPRDFKFDVINRGMYWLKG